KNYLEKDESITEKIVVPITDQKRDDTEKEIREKVEMLKESQKMIYKARKLENNLAYKQKIESYIEKRYKNFANNTKKMISTVAYYKDRAPVIINSIIYENHMTTKPKKIKQKIKEHFRKWTRHNPKNEEAWTIGRSYTNKIK
ncbi:805_t:CDS:2, partial [Gigaspora margarita]